MSDIKFTLESVRDFMNKNGGRVKNHELVTHFKSFLNDVHRKDEMRERFKTFVNTLATIKMDEQNEKILVLKKKYRLDSGSVSLDPDRARSEPPIRADKSSSDLTDSVPGRVKSEGNLSASDLRLSASTLTSSNDGTSLGSAQSTSSLSSSNPEDDVNLSVVSVKERAKHLNRMESESELQKTSVSPIAVTRINKKDKKVSDGDDSTTSGDFTPLDPLEKEWVVKSSSADYHEMNQLLSKNPKLAKVKDFTTGHTALHWAAKHGRPEVIKLLMGKPGVNVNQRTNGGYTALHLAAQHGHEDIIELLVQGFKADPNIRDYSGKKAKQYLRTSASSRTQQMLTSSRLGPKMSSGKSENNFMRNSGGRRSNRASAIKSLIQASASSMKQTVMRSSWGSLENVNGTPGSTPSVSPRHSAEPSPVQRRKGSFGSRDRDLMPPPSGGTRHRSRQPQTQSMSKENLASEISGNQSSTRKVSRSESEPNLGEATQMG